MNPLERSSRAATTALKVFPLPSAVLFPTSLLPLHIFEPRYRELVRDALAQDSVIALAQLEPGWEPHYAGRPPMKSLCTLGMLVWHEPLPDGRYNIAVRGISRAEILEELPPRARYREVRACPLPDPPFDGPEEVALRRALLELAARMPSAVTEELITTTAHLRGGELVDAVASAFVPGLERRWQLLCERDVAQRMRAAMTDLGEAMARTHAERSQGPLN